MKRQDFIKNTILKLDDDLFVKLKEHILKEKYMVFSFHNSESISKKIFAEKLSDYFEKVSINQSKPFDKLIDKYMSNIDSVVGGKIAKSQKPNKKNPNPIIPRARKYYDKIIGFSKEPNLQNIVDYSRIMMCLYTEIIKNDGKEISDMEYSSECLDINQIIDSLKKEQNGVLKHPKFDLASSYSIDICSFVILIIMFYHIKNNELAGEQNA